MHEWVNDHLILVLSGSSCLTFSSPYMHWSWHSRIWLSSSVKLPNWCRGQLRLQYRLHAERVSNGHLWSHVFGWCMVKSTANLSEYVYLNIIFVNCSFSMLCVPFHSKFSCSEQQIQFHLCQALFLHALTNLLWTLALGKVQNLW